MFLTVHLITPTPAQGQAENEAQMEVVEDVWAGVEELMVVGQGGEGILSSMGTSVTAFDAVELQALGAQDVSDLAQFTPNLEIKTAGSTSATLFIRGIGLNDFTANGSGAVAVYQDDVALNLPAIQMGQLFDVAEVQVLKGPIGSGPGRNASAGAIKIYANKPNGNLSAGLRFDYGNYDFKDAEGHLEVPILEDVLSARFAFRFTERDGWMKNHCATLSETDRLNKKRIICPTHKDQPIPSAGLQKNLNDQHNWAIRGIARFVPPDTDLDMNWMLGVHLGRIDQLGYVGQSFGANEGKLGTNDAGGYKPWEVQDEFDSALSQLPPVPPRRTCRTIPDFPGCDSSEKAQEHLNHKLAERPLDAQPYEGDYNRDGYERQSSWGGFLRGDWTIDPVTITSITGYEFYDRERAIDADFGPNQLFEFDIDDRAWQVTQELRAGGELDAAPISWEVGGYLLREELDYNQLTLDSVVINIFTVDQTYEQKTTSLAAYGEFVWEIIDDLELEAGARYNWERREMDADVVVESSPLCENSSIRPGPEVCEDVQTFDHPTGTLQLRYYITPDVTVSAKYTHGWKGAQYNVRDGTTQFGAIDIAKPEKIDAVEWGVGGSWFDGRLNLQGALFFYKYQDYQVFTFSNIPGVPPQRIVINADDAQLYGAEIETRIEPIDRLVIDFKFGWLESKFLEYSQINRRLLRASPDAPADQVQVPFDYSGNRLPNTPRFKISLALTYTWEMGKLGSLIPRYDLAWTDDIFFDETEGNGNQGIGGDAFPDFSLGQKDHSIHNFRLTYRTLDGGLEVAGWVRNMTNTLYKVTTFNASQGVRLIGNFVGEPRTYGLSVSVKF